MAAQILPRVILFLSAFAFATLISATNGADDYDDENDPASSVPSLADIAMADPDFSSSASLQSNSTQ